MYTVDLLIPTARFVFGIEGDHVVVLPEHRSPEAFAHYARWREERAVAGMMTFPNSLLVRGSTSFVIDPGLPLQNAPLLGALRERFLGPEDLAFVALTHAHYDHAGGLADLPLPVVVHEREMLGSHWGTVRGILERHELRFLRGGGGELLPGVRWALTEAHTPGSVSYAIETADGVVVVCGDIVGPVRRPFDEMTPEGPHAAELLAAWRRIRDWRPARLVAGHIPPFAP